jgi:hypothetical protein
MPRDPPIEALTDWLTRLTAGSLGASVDGTEIARVDADARVVTVQLDPLLDPRTAGGRAFPGVRVPLWSVRGVPSALARRGWRVNVRSEGRDIVNLGRDVSPLTGHVRLHLRGLGRLRRLL